MIIAVNFQFKQLERRSLKKSGLQRDSNLWPSRYRCDALPTELWSHKLGARSIFWVHIFPWSEMIWSIYDIIHIWTAVMVWKWRMIVAVNFQFKQSGQFKYELFHIYFTSFHSTGRYELNKLTSLPMCGFIAQLIEHRTGILQRSRVRTRWSPDFSGFFFPIA